MPKRTDIESILIIGAGPIIIGQACEFDYSGTQACKALREEGYRVILVNSNPATIMTDPDVADAVYVEPVNWKVVEKIIAKEKPDALLPTMGGQTGLNCALDLAREGVLEKYGVEMIGASREAIDTAEDRQKFRIAMDEIGLESARSGIAHTMDEAWAVQASIGFPAIIRPSFTLGGSGGGIAYNRDEFEEIVSRGLDLSPTNEVLLEESLLGWKEFEMEVVRDRNDNAIIVCAIENLDPMGVHTGDSITVAPAQTLTDKEYQIMRNASLAVLRKIGVETGGSNVQFSVNPADGRLIVIEMNPRVSRSSALASKATGFPIAKVAAKLAVGYTLDELANEITGGQTPASFEPSIDYVVTKIPRFAFEKFAAADDKLTTQMKSVGEVMAIGRSFPESLQKALRGLEIGSAGFETQLQGDEEEALTTIKEHMAVPRAKRLWWVADGLRHGLSVDEVYRITAIDPWFLEQIGDIIDAEKALSGRTLTDIPAVEWRELKQLGCSDIRLAELLGTNEAAVREARQEAGVRPIFKRVDTCAAEFPTDTAYLYSSYDEECEAQPSDRRKIMVLGGGPNRIGQGIEFDYCCVHAALALREDGYETIMVNCNPETVSTDFDTSDRLYFEPLTLEDVLAVVDVEKPEGVIVQFGGQTPLKLAQALEEAGVPIIGTTPDSIDLAEDRERFQQLVIELGLNQPRNRIAMSTEQALAMAEDVGFPLVVRPSYVLGGRAMEVVYGIEDLERYMNEAVQASDDSPVLLDRFLEAAIEVDVDAVCDGTDVVVAGIMEHIEQAGVHSGDSACSLPPYSLPAGIEARLCTKVVALAKALKVSGLMNTQFAIQGENIYLLEVNPRAARTVPFVSKAIGAPLAKIAARCMAGQSLKSQGFTRAARPDYFSVKESVFPFNKFPGVDPILGPEMKSTGEVMGVGRAFGGAFGKALLAGGSEVPDSGGVLLSVRDEDKGEAVRIARHLASKGFTVWGTSGTARTLTEAGVECRAINKVQEGRPHCVDLIKNGEVSLVVNTASGKKSIAESHSIRAAAIAQKVVYFTTVAGAWATCLAMDHKEDFEVTALRDLHQELTV